MAVIPYVVVVLLASDDAVCDIVFAYRNESSTKEVDGSVYHPKLGR
jgi:hypothetical protein